MRTNSCWFLGWIGKKKNNNNSTTHQYNENLLDCFCCWKFHSRPPICILCHSITGMRCRVQTSYSVLESQQSSCLTKKNHLCHNDLQIQRIEEEDQVFALEISKAHFLELSIVDSCGLKSRSWLSDSSCPSESSWKMEESHLFTWSLSFMKQATKQDSTLKVISLLIWNKTNI